MGFDLQQISSYRLHTCVKTAVHHLGVNQPAADN